MHLPGHTPSAETASKLFTITNFLFMKTHKTTGRGKNSGRWALMPEIYQRNNRSRFVALRDGTDLSRLSRCALELTPATARLYSPTLSPTRGRYPCTKSLA